MIELNSLHPRGRDVIDNRVFGPSLGNLCGFNYILQGSLRKFTHCSLPIYRLRKLTKISILLYFCKYSHQEWLQQTLTKITKLMLHDLTNGHSSLTSLKQSNFTITPDNKHYKSVLTQDWANQFMDSLHESLSTDDLSIQESF